MADDPVRQNQAEERDSTNDEVQRNLDAAEKRISSEHRETVLATGRRAFITALVAILLNPFSVGLGYLINKWLDTPHLTILDIDEGFQAADYQLPIELADNIQRLGDFPLRLKDAIRAASADSDCTGWLVGRGLQDNCTSTVIDAVSTLHDLALTELSAGSANLRIISSWDGQGPLPTLTPMLAYKPQDLAILAAAGKTKNTPMPELAAGVLDGTLRQLRLELVTLEKLQQKVKEFQDKRPKPRTGEMEFHIGVFNDGDADGVVRLTSNLQFNDKSLPLIANDHTIVKAHSFSRITFTIAKKDIVSDLLTSKEIPVEVNIGSYDSVLDLWRANVKQGTPQSYMITLNPMVKPVTFSKSLRPLQ